MAGDFKWWLFCGAAYVIALVLVFWPKPIDSGYRMSKHGRVRSDIVAIHTAVEEYAINNDGRYPNDLRVLVTSDEHGNAYLEGKAVPKDPWRREYRYEPPTEDRPKPRVFCLGKDGLPGGEGDDADTDELFYLDPGER